MRVIILCVIARVNTECYELDDFCSIIWFILSGTMSFVRNRFFQVTGHASRWLTLIATSEVIRNARISMMREREEILESVPILAIKFKYGSGFSVRLDNGIFCVSTSSHSNVNYLVQPFDHCSTMVMVIHLSTPISRWPIFSIHIKFFIPSINFRRGHAGSYVWWQLFVCETFGKNLPEQN